MYHTYFGLKEAPFSIAPNPRYLFMSRRHKEALAHLLYGVNHGGGFVLLTGEVGTGKTTVSRALLKQLPKNTDIAYILNPTLSASELLASICDELKVTGVADKSSIKDLSDCLHRFLLDNHARGRNTVLIIDEAQHLEYKVMEQIRLLTNLETDDKKLLQIVFIGQPELNELLAKPELRQLAQRITARFHIEPLTFAETQAYVRHRLMIAGMPASQSLINNAAVKIIFNACSGIPRLINVACDRALLGAYTHNSPVVTAEIAKAAVAESASPLTKNAAAKHLPMAVAASLVLAIIAVGAWLLLGTIGKSTTAPQAATSANAPANNIAKNMVNNTAGTIDRSIPESLAPAPQLSATVESAEETLATTASSQQEATNPEPDLSDPANLYPLTYSQKDQAINALQQALGVFPAKLDNPCSQLNNFGVDCLNEAMRSWGQLDDYNRPAVLTLAWDNEQRYLAVTARAPGNRLQTLPANGTTQELAMFDLGQYWTGETTLLWQPPDTFQPLLKPGQSSEFVAWVADAFASLDQQAQPLAQSLYNTALAQRVTLFQAEHGLEPDGLVGLRTVLKINDALATDFRLSASAAEVQ